MANKVVATNRKAYHDYHIGETYEAGIVLTGTEIKSVRQGMVSLRDSFARVENGEVFLYNMNVSPYDAGNRFNHEPRRTRKLLLNKSEIRKLATKTQEKGFTLVPLKVYLKNGWAKVELALARGKRLYDKREDIKKRDIRRQVDRAIKDRGSY
ncbi:MAG: SsrA-binding protein SmpB [Bacillota bacterium]|nr:SsrA-binding protein SmpB [Bacillota bacterium]MDI9415026.1 SsrA-binding protein SmpB [Bacillota bacterium]NLD12641.1 SsrA-binding protein SmpB [Bacillota bacterium]HOB88718.1 SsrA-binding protein SmpB [Bacillota bacterium]HOJ58217.1 SsrA-binding protein SmpB [Bacillota bacterium]